MAKKSNISLLNPIVKKNIREEENKIGRKLNREERHEFIKNDKKRIKKSFRKATIVAALAAVGITVGAKAMLPEPKDNNVNIEQSKTENSKSKEEQFRENLQAQTPIVHTKQEEKENDIITEISKKYDLTEEQIGIIKSMPDYYTKDKKTGEYGFDYYEKQNPEEYDIVERSEKNGVKDALYTIVNKTDNTIISSIGNVDFNIVNVNVSQIKTTSNNKEYVLADKTMDLTIDENGNKKSQEELDNVYKNVENKYEQIKEQQENDQR